MVKENLELNFFTATIFCTNKIVLPFFFFFLTSRSSKMVEEKQKNRTNDPQFIIHTNTSNIEY